MSQMDFAEAEYAHKKRKIRRELFLENYKLGKVILDTVNQHLAAQGLLLREGSIVDASIISAPPSTRNISSERDPEMHSVKKGNQFSARRRKNRQNEASI